LPRLKRLKPLKVRDLAKLAYGVARPVLPFALAAGLLAGLVFSVDAGAIKDELTGANLAWLPLILAANFASDWFRGVRWQHLLSPLQRPGVSLLFAASQVGSTVNLLIPLRAGEAVRVQIVSQRSGVSASSLVATLFGEVVSDLATFSAFIIVGLLLLKEAQFLWPLAVLFGVLMLGGLLAGFFVARDAAGRPEPLPVAGAGRFRSWFKREIYNFARGLQSFREPGVLFHIAWSAQAIWLTEAVMFYACGESLGLDISVGAYLLMVVAANVAGALPVTQAGLGVFEVTLTGLMVALGVDQAQAVAYAIFVHLLLTVPHIVTGPIAALALRVSFADMLFLGRRPPPASPD